MAGTCPDASHNRMQKDADIHARQFLAFLATLKKGEIFRVRGQGTGKPGGTHGRTTREERHRAEECRKVKNSRATRTECLYCAI